jgi:hypothetical protein
MVVAANSAALSNAIEPSPSDTSLRSLDAVNLLLAGALSGFGPYVAVFLAEQEWTHDWNPPTDDPAAPSGGVTFANPEHRRLFWWPAQNSATSLIHFDAWSSDGT